MRAQERLREGARVRLLSREGEPDGEGTVVSRLGVHVWIVEPDEGWTREVTDDRMEVLP